MNRRSFFKFLPAIFTPFLPEPKISGEETNCDNTKVALGWDSACGLGKYKSHLMITGTIGDAYLFPATPNDVYRAVNFPIEGQLRIIFEKGIEEYRCFNPYIETIKEINELDSFNIFYDLYNNVIKPKEYRDKNGDILTDPFNRAFQYKKQPVKFWLTIVDLHG